LQFPDGLKQYATSIVDYLEENTKSEYLIFFGNCYGACDLPIGIEKIKIDLVVQFGHSPLMPSY
jgi:2-(3-amino-3-carboxypropyl)histidine synthase